MLTVLENRGFEHKHPCLPTSIRFLDKVTGRMYRGESIEAFYLDFQKAFVFVSHRFLDQKVKALGGC